MSAAGNDTSTEEAAARDQSSAGEPNIDPADATSAAQTATAEQLAGAPNSTAARHAAGETINDNGSEIAPGEVDTAGRHPLHPSEQAQTGAPGGADGAVVVRGESEAGATEQEVKAAVERQHADLPGEGGHIVFNTTSTPLVVDREGHQLDAKARRRLPELDAVTRAAISSGDLIDETGDETGEHSGGGGDRKG